MPPPEHIKTHLLSILYLMLLYVKYRAVFWLLMTLKCAFAAVALSEAFDVMELNRDHYFPLD